MRPPLHQWRRAHSSTVHEQKEKPGGRGGIRRHCGLLKLCSFVDQVLGPTCLTSRAGLRPSEVILRITRTMSVGQQRNHYVVGNVQPSLYVFKQLTLYVFNVLSSDSVRFARHCTFSKAIRVMLRSHGFKPCKSRGDHRSTTSAPNVLCTYLLNWSLDIFQSRTPVHPDSNIWGPVILTLLF